MIIKKKRKHERTSRIKNVYIARKDIIILLCVDNVNILITEKHIAIISLADNSG